MEGKAHEGNAGCSFPMQKMAEAEDVEAYFSAFEHTAMIEERPKEQWAALLLPLLTGEALAAYKDLQADAKQDYEKLKTEILNCLGIKSSVNDECTMDDWSYQWEKPPHSQIYSLIHLTRKWLKPDSSSVSQVVDRLVLHQFQKALPTTVKSSIHQIDPKNVKELIALLEKEPLRYNVALKSDKPNIPGIILFAVFKNFTVKVGRPPKDYMDSFYDRSDFVGKLPNASLIAFHPDGNLYVIKDTEIYMGPIPSDQSQDWFSLAKRVGKNTWNQFKCMLFHPNGDLYAVTKDGDLYKGPAPSNDNISWRYEQATRISEGGWNFDAYFFDGEGFLYVVTSSGELRKRHPPINISDKWNDTSSIVDGSDWQNLSHFIGFSPDGDLWCVEKNKGNIYRGPLPTNREMKYMDTAKHLGYDYNLYKFLSFSRDTTITNILAFEFLIDEAKTLSESIEVVERQNYDNRRSTTPLKCAFTFSRTIKEVSEFSHEHGFTVALGSELTFEAGIPLISKAEIKAHLDVSTTHNWKWSTINEREVSFSATTDVEVQGGKAVRLEATVRKAEINIPYRAKVCTLFGYENMISGTFNGVSHYDLVVKQEDVTL